MKRIVSLLMLVLYLGVISSVRAQGSLSCDDRYAVLVNPIRDRSLWFDKSLKPIEDQYKIIEKHSLPATWLIQYDVLEDQDLSGYIKTFKNNQEIGVFLEISSKLTNNARVIYPVNTPWFYPNAVFLSGYSQSDRIKLIDRLFIDFKKRFGYFPKSIGAWWIDSYSLEYLSDKYSISSVMIVADQLTTDNYGVWGQLWGVPYYPSKENILSPAASLKDKLPVTIIQWAQRDPLLAHNPGPQSSNYSLQANDYIRQGKNTDYFKEISQVYLDCQNPLGQITVGLETGQESIGFIDEYANQIQEIAETKNLQTVTMSKFSEKYKSLFPKLNPTFKLTYQDSGWLLTNEFRENKKLNDKIIYKNLSFSDYFVADKQIFLNRNITTLNNSVSLSYIPIYLFPMGFFGVYFWKKKNIKVWVLGMILDLAAFGSVLRSNFLYGWKVFYGPVFENIYVVQVLVVTIVFSLIVFINYKLKKIRNLDFYLFFISLTYGLDFIIEKLRVSFISEKYIVGIFLDSLRFLGIAFSKNGTFEIVNKDLPDFLAAGFLKFNFYKIWNNNLISFFLYPLIHILVGIALGYLVLRLPLRFKKITIVLMFVLLMGHLIYTFSLDPLIVLPYK